MSVKGFIAAAASIAVLGGCGYYGYTTYIQPTQSASNVGQMNTSKIDRQQAKAAKAQHDADAKKYQIPKVNNRAERHQQITSDWAVNGTDSNVSIFELV